MNVDQGSESMSGRVQLSCEGGVAKHRGSEERADAVTA